MTEDQKMTRVERMRAFCSVVLLLAIAFTVWVMVTDGRLLKGDGIGSADESSIERATVALVATDMPEEALKSVLNALNESTGRSDVTYENGQPEIEVWFYADDTQSLSVRYHRNGAVRLLWVYDTNGIERWRIGFEQNGSIGDFWGLKSYDEHGTMRLHEEFSDGLIEYRRIYDENGIKRLYERFEGGSIKYRHTYDANGTQID